MYEAIPTPGHPLDRCATPEEAERFAQQTDWYVEYAHGRLFAMAGGTPEHGAVLMNLLTAVAPHVRRAGCRAHEGHTRLYVNKTDYYLPDVRVTCGDRPTAGQMGYHDAIFVAEVLSDETAPRDLDTKLVDYRQLPSLRDYVLIDSRTRRVQHYQRVHGTWHHTVLLPGATPTPAWRSDGH
jgi:Uma2 family endonuclease